MSLAERIVADGLSVRQAEKLAAQLRAKPRPRHSLSPASDPNADALELQLAEALGMPVALAVSPGGESGSLTIRFASLDQLDWLCARIGSA